MMNIPPDTSLLTSFLKPFILLGIVLLLVFHPHAQAAAGLCLLVTLGGWFLEGSLLAGNGATWASMGRALTAASTLPFYALLLVGSSTLGFTRVESRPTVASVAQAFGSSEAGYRPVAAKAKAPEGGCSSASGCGSSGGCGTGGCGASSGGACGCSSGAAKKTTVASASTTAPQPNVSRQRPAPMPGLMVPIQTPNRGTSPASGASPSASLPAMAMASPRPQVIRPGPLQQGPAGAQGLPQGQGPGQPSQGTVNTAAQAAPPPVVSRPPQPPVSAPLTSRVIPSAPAQGPVSASTAEGTLAPSAPAQSSASVPSPGSTILPPIINPPPPVVNK